MNLCVRETQNKSTNLVRKRDSREQIKTLNEYLYMRNSTKRFGDKYKTGRVIRTEIIVFCFLNNLVKKKRLLVFF